MTEKKISLTYKMETIAKVQCWYKQQKYNSTSSNVNLKIANEWLLDICKYI